MSSQSTDRLVFDGIPNLRLSDAWESRDRWRVIREYYAGVAPLILRGERVPVYELGLGNHMTPIEHAVWCEIRYHGLPFYLQYPVGRRFVDFGDPVKQIAIEVDGAAYHTPRKDAIRDAELFAHGWGVLHISGRDAFLEENILAPVLEIYGLREDGSRQHNMGVTNGEG